MRSQISMRDYCRNSDGSFTTFAAIRRASSLVSRLAAC
jgi:hypothetical protein